MEDANSDECDEVVDHFETRHESASCQGVDYHGHNQPERKVQRPIIDGPARRGPNVGEEFECRIEDVDCEKVEEQGNQGGGEECTTVERACMRWDGYAGTKLKV